MANWVSTLTLSFLFIFAIHAVECIDYPTTAVDMDYWCNQTPYPQACKQYMNHTPPAFAPKTKTDFHKMTVQVALERALHAELHTIWLGKECRNSKEKTAWEDCLQLYQNTILQLNRTLQSPYKTQVDTQTWLSAALTNLETCRTGFIELGVSDFLPPLMANNVSQLISNSLAANKLGTADTENGGSGRRLLSDGFPDWVSVDDRRLLLSSSSPASQADLVVAKDGSGDFKTITKAVAAAGKGSGGKRFVIYVKAGVYNENVEIDNSLKNLKFVGDGIGKTIVSGSKSVAGGSTTFNSATFAVSADGFVATDMTFRNTAGPQNHQAVALRVGADLSVLYRCSIEGYQDTLYVHSLRQFYRECNIAGTVDFIFGNAAVVFQNCNIYPRKPMEGQENAITAQGRTDPNQNTGISIHNSRVTASSDLKPVSSSVKTYLGRPWQEYSRTIFMQTFLDSLIDPAGWLEWNGKFALETLFYREYKNTGPGSSTSKRVKWSGYRAITDPKQALPFTVGRFIAGGSWIPSTGVPFTSGL